MFCSAICAVHAHAENQQHLRCFSRELANGDLDFATCYEFEKWQNLCNIHVGKVYTIRIIHICVEFNLGVNILAMI